MCVEKTPWERVADFHGHSCPGVALGFKLAQIANRELGVKPNPAAELIARAETYSCALDALQVLNQVTLGKRTLQVSEKGKHVYSFQYQADQEILRLSVKPSVLERLAVNDESATPRQKQNRNLELIQFILSTPDSDFCTISRVPGSLMSKPTRAPWLTCPVCGDAVRADFAVPRSDGQPVCPDCADNRPAYTSEQGGK